MRGVEQDSDQVPDQDYDKDKGQDKDQEEELNLVAHSSRLIGIPGTRPAFDYLPALQNAVQTCLLSTLPPHDWKHPR
jgi:hypothetical protein